MAITAAGIWVCLAAAGKPDGAGEVPKAGEAAPDFNLKFLFFRSYCTAFK